MVRAVGSHALLLLVIVGSFTGCGGAEDRHIATLRKKLLLGEEPVTATSIAEAKKNIADQPEVVLVGRIGAGDDDPFVNGKAAFVVSDIPAHGHTHGAGQTADDCPFCKHRAAQAAWAAVQFVDEQGQVVPVDARTLFGLDKGSVVVVRGRGQVTGELSLFSVTANGIHIRK